MDDNALPFCDECGEERESHPLYNPATTPSASQYFICKECYEATPEPDTGRPDWEDLK